MQGQFGKVVVDSDTVKEAIGVDFDIENDTLDGDKHLPIYLHKRYKYDGEFVNESLVKFGSGDRDFTGMTSDEAFEAIFEDKEVRGDHVKATHLLIVPKQFKKLEWDDTLIGNKILRHIDGAEKLSREKGFGNEVIKGSTPEEIVTAIRKYFVGSERPSIWKSSGDGLHTFQKEAYNRIYEAVKRQNVPAFEGKNSEILKVLAYLCPRYGKTRLFLTLMKDLHEDFGYEVLVIPAFWLSSHTSFEKTLMKWREFENMVHIDPNRSGWAKRLKAVYLDDELIPVVTPSLCIEETSKRKLVPITKIPRSERFIPVDEFDFGAWKNTELIDYLVEKENQTWGETDSEKNTPLVHINMTGSGIAECVAGGQKYDEVLATSYGAMEKAKRNGDPTMQHVVLRNYGRWRIGDKVRKKFKEVFGEEAAPGFTKIGKDVDQARKIWRRVFRMMFEGEISTFNDHGARIMKNVGKASIPAAAKEADISTDCLGVFLILPDMENEEIVKLRKLLQETVGHNWPVLALHGGIDDPQTERERGTSNSDAESYTNQFIENEVDSEKHDGFVVMSSRMAFRSFSVPELNVASIIRDGGSADVASQAHSRVNTPGTLLNGKEKEESLIIEYGLDQRRDLTPIEKIWAHETVQETYSSNSDTIEEAYETVTPPTGSFIEYSARKNSIGEVELKEDTWNSIARSNHIAKLIRTNADRDLIESDERVKELVLRAGQSSGKSKTDGEQNGDPASSGGGSGNSSSSDEDSQDEEDIEQCVNTIKHMCFLIRDFAPDQENVIQALRKISETDHLREEWIYLSKAGNPESDGLTPEGFIELLRDKEFMDLDYLNTVYTTYDEVYEEAFNFIMAANKLYEIPQNMAENMAESLRRQIFKSPRSSHRTDNNGGLSVCVIDAAGPHLVRALKNLDAVENVNVLTRLYLAKQYIEQNVDDVDVDVVRGDSELEAYEQAFNDKYNNMEFDVITGNPPYHKSTGTGNPIWGDFAELAIETANEYVVMVHPALWRKPQSNRTYAKNIQPKLFETVQYLSIHDSDEGERIFGAGTRFDWYVANVSEGNDGEIEINDENGETHIVQLEDWPWIPNKAYNLVKKLLGNGCEVLHQYGAYETRADHTNKEIQEDYIHPVIHNTGKNGTKIIYSKETGCADPEHFGESKVIFGDSIPIRHVEVDESGDYGVGKHAIALKFEEQHEAEKMKGTLTGELFTEVLEACSWSNYQIDWRMFQDFKRDWYETVLEIEKQRNDD